MDCPCSSESPHECESCFSLVWDQYVTQLDLCKDCGVPNTLTDLTDEMFKPCDNCRPRLTEFLRAQGLCSACYTLLDEDYFCSYCQCSAPVEVYEDEVEINRSECPCKTCTEWRAEQEEDE